MEEDSLFKQEGYDLMGAAFEVYKEKGCGFLEAIYQECMERELAARRIPFQAKPWLKIFYKGEPLLQGYEADLLVCTGIVTELKAVKMLAPEHEAQLLNYLRATGKKVGYLINFGAHPQIEWKRMVL
ncbi:MAG: GxxExxY protein [Verrucomicrobiota bacterium]